MSAPVLRYIEQLLRRHRPRSFPASPDDVAIIRVAIELRAAAAQSALPRLEFVEELRRQLATQAQSGNTAAPQRLGRRQVLQTATAAVAATAAGSATLAVRSRSQAQHPRVDAATLTPTGVWRTVAVTAELGNGDVRDFDVGSVSGFLHRADGEIRAIVGICTHQGCRLTYAAAIDRLVCPCHGAEFGLDGQPLRCPRSCSRLQRLPSLAVRERGDSIEVLTP